MYDLKNEKYVVLEFSSAESIENKKTRTTIGFSSPCIIEISAVKIAKGKIADSFSRFFKVEGYDSHCIELDETDFNNHGVCAYHLIGAKPLKEELGQLRSFIGDSMLIMRGHYIDSEFKYFKAYARECGIEFNNIVINFSDLLKAFNLQMNILTGKSYENASAVEIAKHLKLDCDTWTDLFIQNDVSFDPSRTIILNCRDDILSWALAIAQLYINLYGSLYPTLETIDEEIPF